ncbi:MAG: SagB/ThcOx family dehydrogenase [Planctomycetota bacterium]
MKTSGSAALRYHVATKYHPETIGQLPAADYDAQPVPFKQYHTERAVELIPYLPHELFPDAGDLADSAGDPDRDLARLSRTLYFTYGATARQVWPGGHQIFRAAPSAGGLYPVEVYLVTQGVEGVPDGFHDYSVPNHQLVPVFDGQFIDELAELTYGAFDPVDTRAVVLLSGLFRRSTWRYHERAYRRILLDAGHVYGNLAQIAREEGFEALPVSSFDDGGVNGTFFLEEEHVQLVVPLLRPALAPTSLAWRRPSSIATTEQEPAAPEQGGDPEWEFLRYQNASHLDRRAEAISRRRLSEQTAPTPVSGVPEVSLEAKFEAPENLPKVILERRSTREFSGEGLSVEQLSELLHAGYDAARAQLSGESTVPRLQVPELLATHVVIRDIDGVTPGSYRLDPVSMVLRCEKAEDLRTEVYAFALGQDLARDAAAVIVHSAELESAVTDYGERAYRALHIDAGVVGQFINLAAVQAGIGVSGIGGFFDDQVNATLGLPDESAILYITVLGASVP